jgi:hypothetical protein
MRAAVGAWEHVMSSRATPFDSMKVPVSLYYLSELPPKVWDAVSNAQIEFGARDSTGTELGHIVENSMCSLVGASKLSRCRYFHAGASSHPQYL